MHDTRANENAVEDDARILPPDAVWPPDLIARYQAAGYWQNATLASQLLDWQQIYREKTALIAEGRSWSYWALIGQARRFASSLNATGVQPGDTVLIQQPNGADFAIALFAALLLGAVPVLMLPAHRQREIVHVATLARARLYLGNDQINGVDCDLLAIALSHVGCHVLISRHDAPFHLCQATMLAPLPETAATHIALLLLSGGTTGFPKLIPRTHADYSYNVRRSVELCDIDGSDRYLAVLPMAHNFTLACPGVLGVWSQGGSVVVPSSPAPEDAFAAIERQGVTVTALVPSLMQCWLDALLIEKANLRSLRLVQVGGAKLESTCAERIPALFGCQLQQVFGMAEGLICMTCLDDPLSVIARTQGKPMCPEDEIRVMDAEGRPVPVGDTGELWVRGPYTLRGYFRSPEHNHHAFTSDGFYRTGDRVRLLPDGYLCVEGRIKDTINRHGESISAEEIEDCLLAHPEVRQAVAIAEQQGEINESIHAVIVAKSTITLADIRAFFEQKDMDINKWPERLSLVKTMPLTAIGKVDKKALAAQLSAGVMNHSREP